MCKNENPRLCARNGSRHTHKYKKVILDPLYNPILLITQQLARIFYRWDEKDFLLKLKSEIILFCNDNRRTDGACYYYSQGNN